LAKCSNSVRASKVGLVGSGGLGFRVVQAAYWTFGRKCQPSLKHAAERFFRIVRAAAYGAVRLRASPPHPVWKNLNCCYRFVVSAFILATRVLMALLVFIVYEV